MCIGSLWITAVIVIADVESPSSEKQPPRGGSGETCSHSGLGMTQLCPLKIILGHCMTRIPPVCMVLMSHHLHISADSSLNYHSFCVSVGGNLELGLTDVLVTNKSEVSCISKCQERHNALNILTWGGCWFGVFFPSFLVKN